MTDLTLMQVVKTFNQISHKLPDLNFLKEFLVTEARCEPVIIFIPAEYFTFGAKVKKQDELILILIVDDLL